MIKKIKLKTIDAVKEFASHASKFMGEVTITSGKYAVDGRSLLGIFSLDLSKSINVEIEERDSELWDMLCSQYETKES